MDITNEITIKKKVIVEDETASIGGHSVIVNPYVKSDIILGDQAIYDSVEHEVVLEESKLSDFKPFGSYSYRVTKGGEFDVNTLAGLLFKDTAYKNPTKYFVSLDPKSDLVGKVEVSNNKIQILEELENDKDIASSLIIRYSVYVKDENNVATKREFIRPLSELLVVTYCDTKKFTEDKNINNAYETIFGAEEALKYSEYDFYRGAFIYHSAEH